MDQPYHALPWFWEELPPEETVSSVPLEFASSPFEKLENEENDLVLWILLSGLEDVEVEAEEDE